MSISLNGGSNPTSITFNGNAVTAVTFNGTTVWEATFDARWTPSPADPYSEKLVIVGKGNGSSAVKSDVKVTLPSMEFYSGEKKSHYLDLEHPGSSNCTVSIPAIKLFQNVPATVYATLKDGSVSDPFSATFWLTVDEEQTTDENVVTLKYMSPLWDKNWTKVSLDAQTSTIEGKNNVLVFSKL